MKEITYDLPNHKYAGESQRAATRRKNPAGFCLENDAASLYENQHSLHLLWQGALEFLLCFNSQFCPQGPAFSAM